MRISRLLPVAGLALLVQPAAALEIRPGLYELRDSYSERFHPAPGVELPPGDVPAPGPPPMPAEQPQMVCVPEDTAAWLQDRLAQLMGRPDTEFGQHIEASNGARVYALRDANQHDPELYAYEVQLIPRSESGLSEGFSFTTRSTRILPRPELHKTITMVFHYSFHSDECPPSVD